MEKTFMIDPLILVETIWRNKKGLGKDYTTGFLLDDEYIKNHYKLITVNLSWQKELDADPKAIQHIEFVGQSKNIDGGMVHNLCLF